MFSLQNKKAVATIFNATMDQNGSEVEVPVQQTLENLKNLMLNPIKQIPPSNKIKIITKSAVERFTIILEEPVSFQYLEDYYRRRHAGMEFKIYHANNTFDFLQQITSQKDLDDAIRFIKISFFNF
jgi:hypothetical protein